MPYPSPTYSHQWSASSVRYALRMPLREFSTQSPRKPSNGKRSKRKKLTFLDFPSEVLIEISRYLDFGDISKLRRVCRPLRAILCKRVVRSLYPDYVSFIQAAGSTCNVCLKTTHPLCLILLEGETRRRPYVGACLKCAHKHGYYIRGQDHELARGGTAFSCRRCHWPVFDCETGKHFHFRCETRVRKMFRFWMIVWTSQMLLFAVGTAMIWVHFHHHPGVMASSVVSRTTPFSRLTTIGFALIPVLSDESIFQRVQLLSCRPRWEK